MRQHKPSKGDGTPMGRWWALFAVAVTVLIGATWIAAQELTPRSSQHPVTRPFREPPPLIPATEARQRLAERHRALRERFLAHQQRRRAQPTDSYAIPVAPADTDGRPRPDAPGGEFHAGGAR